MSFYFKGQTEGGRLNFRSLIFGLQNFLLSEVSEVTDPNSLWS